MHDDLLLAEVESNARAFATVANLTGLLTDRVLAYEERIAELAGDVAELGTRVSELERAARNEHSLAVEVEAITDRIDKVHERALRALTNLTEGKSPA